MGAGEFEKEFTVRMGAETAQVKCAGKSGLHRTHGKRGYTRGFVPLCGILAPFLPREKEPARGRNSPRPILLPHLPSGFGIRRILPVGEFLSGRTERNQRYAKGGGFRMPSPFRIPLPRRPNRGNAVPPMLDNPLVDGGRRKGSEFRGTGAVRGRGGVWGRIPRTDGGRNNPRPILLPHLPSGFGIRRISPVGEFLSGRTERNQRYAKGGGFRMPSPFRIPLPRRPNRGNAVPPMLDNPLGDGGRRVILTHPPPNFGIRGQAPL